MCGPEPNPKAINIEGVIIILFGEVAQQLHQKGRDDHCKSVAGGEMGDPYVSKERPSCREELW